MNLLARALGVGKAGASPPDAPPPSNAEKMEWVHTQLDHLDDDPRQCIPMQSFAPGMRCQQCVDAMLQALSLIHI